MAENKEKMQIEEAPKRELVKTDLILEEFELPTNELLDQFKVGEIGKVIIPVEVVRVEGDKIKFRKRGASEVQGKFDQLTVAEMKKSLPIAER